MPRCRTLFAFALKMIRKPLHFVQRGRILLRCGSAFALSLPSLGVSSLDLGRLFIQAALFSCRVLHHRHSGARSEPQMRNCASGNPEIGLRDSGFSPAGCPGMTSREAARRATPPPPGTGRDRRAEPWPAHRQASRNRQRLARTCRCVRAAAHPCRWRG
jgi:hypothetical protein